MSDEFAVALATIDAFAGDAARMSLSGVTRRDVDRLVATGALSAGVPGAPWTSAQTREIHERLAAASGDLWFVMAQHRSPAETAAATDNLQLRERFAKPLLHGELLGAVSFAHLRRQHAGVVAQRSRDGWSVSGRLDWITSWGLADVLLLMAETADGEVVQMLLPASERAGLSVTGRLPLAAMRGTSTVAAELHDLAIADAEVAAVLDKQQWLTVDEERTANAPPVVFGLARAAVNALAELGDARSWATALDAASAFAEQLIAVRGRAYALVEEEPATERLDERRRLRAAASRLAVDAVAALTVAQGGRSMLDTSREARWAREAQFALVQAQTHATREAWLSTMV